jgi:hypothetical protein
VPLVRSRLLRSLIAAALVLAGFALTGAALVSFVWLDAPGLLAVAFAVFVAAPFMARAVVDGRWPGRPAVIAAVLSAGFYAVVGVLAARLAAHAVATRDTLGTASAVTAFWLAVVAGCLLALAGLVVAVPLPAPRRVVAVAAACGVAAALVGAGAAAATVRHDSCRDFRFDASRWRTALAVGGADARALASAVAWCHTFTGASPAAVRRALGPPDGPWSWIVSEGGLMHLSELQLSFGPDRRVSGARIVDRAF